MNDFQTLYASESRATHGFPVRQPSFSPQCLRSHFVEFSPRRPPNYKWIRQAYRGPSKAFKEKRGLCSKGQPALPSRKEIRHSSPRTPLWEASRAEIGLIRTGRLGEGGTFSIKDRLSEQELPAGCSPIQLNPTADSCGGEERQPKRERRGKIPGPPSNSVIYGRRKWEMGGGQNFGHPLLAIPLPPATLLSFFFAGRYSLNAAHFGK